MEPEPEPVTLLVKSPNQRHRDLELSGDRSWSVGRLKAHLSRVYPERPVRGGPPTPAASARAVHLAAPKGAVSPPLCLYFLSPAFPRRPVLPRSALPDLWSPSSWPPS